MFHNYLKIALRTFFKNKVFTGITVLGLAVGIACFILTFLYVRHEVSFDEFHSKKDRIFRVVMELHQPKAAAEAMRHNVFLDPELLRVLQETNPSMQFSSRYQRSWTWFERGIKLRQDRVAFVDPGFLQMMSFPLLAGDLQTALNDPNSIILTEELVSFFFGEKNGNYSEILGEVVTLPSSRLKEFIVRGVMKDLPDNTVFRFSAITPYENWRGMGSSNNGFGRCEIFLELDTPRNMPATELNIGGTFMSHYPEQITRGQNQGDLSLEDNCLSCFLQPLNDCYLNPDIDSDYVRNGNIGFTYTMSGLAALILLIACINAVSIQLGQAMVRSREVGIRKVVGANRGQLMAQFFMEAVLLSSFALVVALLLAELLLPLLNQFSGEQLVFSLFESVDVGCFLLLALSVITVIIGGFPSLLMSRFSPLVVLNFQKPTRGRGLFTSGLVVAQFAITIGLFFCVFVMQQQIEFAQNKASGFQKEGVMVLSLPGDMEDNRKIQLKNRLKASASVINVGGSDRDFSSGQSSGSAKNKYNEFITVRALKIDEDFLETMGIPLLQGENFSSEMSQSLKHTAIANETFVKQFYLDQPVGETIEYWNRKIDIIGVVKDFHFDSMRRELQPLFLHMWPFANTIQHYFIRYKVDSAATCRNEVETIWKDFEPNRSPQIRYLDTILQERYDSEKRMSRIITTISIIAIILSCMGLWGITSIAVARRTREIGIRKVLGASEVGIWTLFSHDLVKLFCLSLIIAIPLSWRVMSRWLDQFAYHIDIPWWVFFQAGLFCIVTAFCTVSWLVIRAANRHPVESLRYE